MPKTLRKMLGNVNTPYFVSLMRLIETQSKMTLANWCIDYAEQYILPIYEKHCPGDERHRRAIALAHDWFYGKVKWPEVRCVANENGREFIGEPIADAAMSAVGQAIFTIHVPMHSLRFASFGSAAVAYDRLGLDEASEIYDEMAEDFYTDYANALRAVAVENEPNPAKINWRNWV